MVLAVFFGIHLWKKSCKQVLANHSLFVISVIFASILTCIYLKAQGHVTVSKPVISIIYIVSHTWPLCSARILVDGVNPLESYFQKSNNISAIVQHMSVSFVSLRSSRAHLQNSTVILRNIVEDLCDTAYQKCCKIVISKEVCLHYVTLPF